MAVEPKSELILIVDDTPTNVAVISGALKQDGYRMKVATNGERALALAGAEDKPDLILLDIMMPGMDGYEVCQRLKVEPATRDIPVIFITALTESQDEETGFLAGAVDYVHKPFSAPIVRARVRTHLALQEALNQAREATRRADQARAREEEFRRQVERSRQQFELLSQISDALASSLDYETTLERVCRLAVPVLADWCTVDMLAADGTIDYVAAAHVDPENERVLLQLHDDYPPALDTSLPAAHVLRTGRSLLTPLIDEEVLRATTQDEEHFQRVNALHPTSVMGVPLLARGAVIGVMTLVSTRSDLRYDESDLPMVEEVAHRCAVAVDNARLYRRAREEAASREA